MPSFSPTAWKIFGCSTVLLRFMYSTKPLTPPEYAKFSLLPSRWSISSIFVAVVEERQLADALREDVVVELDAAEGLAATP